jgi:hypothetical protein
MAYTQKYEMGRYEDKKRILTGLLVHGTDGIVVLVDQDTPFIHQS